MSRCPASPRETIQFEHQSRLSWGAIDLQMWSEPYVVQNTPANQIKELSPLRSCRIRRGVEQEHILLRGEAHVQISAYLYHYSGLSVW